MHEKSDGGNAADEALSSQEGAEQAGPGEPSGALTVLLSGLGLLTDTYDLQVTRGRVRMRRSSRDAKRAQRARARACSRPGRSRAGLGAG
jgi:hypothetical protein